MPVVMRSLLFALASILAVSPDAAQGSQPARIAFARVTIVPMDRERLIEDATVLVQGDRIAAIGPAASLPIPHGALQVDGRGRYLVPGIAETHAHMPGERDRATNEILALYALTGATTVRAMNGTPFQLDLRRRIAEDEILGPTIFAVAPPFSGESVGGPDDARSKVRAYQAAGFDVLKIFPGMGVATYDAILGTAREVGIRVSGHVPPEVGLRHAIAQGQSIEHLDGYVEASDGETAAIDALVRATREAGIWNTPTMDVWKTLLGTRSTEELRSRPELRYLPADTVERWARQTAEMTRRRFWDSAVERMGLRRSPQETVALRDRILRALHRGGARLLLGADSPQVYSVPGFSLAHEMRAMVEAGLPAYAVLEAATRNPAAFFGQEAEFGTVEVGKRADLILVEGNPLEDIRNVHRQAGVMVRGRWLPKQEIDRRLEEIAQKWASDPLTSR